MVGRVGVRNNRIEQFEADEQLAFVHSQCVDLIYCNLVL